MEIGWTGSSSCPSVYTTPATSTGPVPPTIPEARPPSAPFPVKSFGSKGFCSRSTGGMSFGMSVGATTVWNPLGGGFCETITSGGGWSGGGGGGGGGLRKTIVVSTTAFFTASAPAAVTLTAAAITAACTTKDVTVCPIDFFDLSCDSIRFSNTQQPPGGGEFVRGKLAPGG